jgi:hypothetical protein
MSDQLTNISVYETAQKVYVVGEATEQDDCWRLLKIDRTNSPAAEDLSVVDPTEYSWRELQSLLRCLHEGNLSSGGLRKIIGPCPALLGACFSWSASPYLLLCTRTRLLGHIGGNNNPIYGIDATSLIPLGLPGEALPESIAAEENRARRLLSLVALTKDFFFSFSWPIWSTVQRTFASIETETSSTLYTQDQHENLMQNEAFSSDRVWNDHLTSRLRSSLSDGKGHSRWVVPLVHGFFEQKQLSLLGRPLLLTLVARRSCRFAGTRYRKRGVTDDGEVANDVEIEQILEFIDNSTMDKTPQMSSVVQVRGSVPLFWSQTWDTSTAAATAALRPSIRMLHHLDPLYSATRKHFDDLRRRYGYGTIHCLDLLRHGDSRQQESVLSGEFKNAIMFLNRRAPSVSQRVGYVHWDLRRHAKKLGSSLLVDLQRVQAPLLANTGIFTTTATSEFKQKQQEKQQCLQHGIVRTNCVDCLDRTNVAQFTYGLLAIGQQLHALGLAPLTTIPIDPGSSLATELMSMYESMGHALAQQYGGSEAHTGFFKQQTTQRIGGGGGGDWQALRDLITSIKRFYSNAVTDEDKQAAINLFLGTFSPAMAAAEMAKWGGWVRGRAERESGASGSGSGGNTSSLLLAPEPSLEDTATTTATDINTTNSLTAASLLVHSPSLPGTPPLPSSLSTASLASELDGGADLSLPELLSSAVVPAGGGGGDSTPRAAVEVEQQQRRETSVQQQLGRKRWPPRASARTHTSPVVSSVGAGSSSSNTTSISLQGAVGGGGLQSFDTMLPRDVRHVRLHSQNPPAPVSMAKTSKAGARGPPVPSMRLVRSSSTGNASQLALEAARYTALPQQQQQQQQQQQLVAGTSVVRNSRDLRGNLVIAPPGNMSSRYGYQEIDAPVLPDGTSGYHTLAGLNLEGLAPELTSQLSAPYPTTFTRPSTAGNSPLSKAKRVSFASLSALRQLVGRGSGGVGGGGDGGGGESSKSEGGGASGYISRSESRSASDLHLHTLPSAYKHHLNTTMAPTGARTSLGAGAGAASTDLSWMFTQRKAVAHGLDDLGLPAQVAPLYRRGSNVVNCYVAMGKQAAAEQQATMAKLSVPMDPAEHRAAERKVAAMLRPEVVVTLPEKAC